MADIHDRPGRHRLGLRVARIAGAADLHVGVGLVGDPLAGLVDQDGENRAELGRGVAGEVDDGPEPAPFAARASSNSKRLRRVRIAAIMLACKVLGNHAGST